MNDISGMGATLVEVTESLELYHCLTRVCRTRKGLNKWNLCNSFSRCEYITSGLIFFGCKYESLKQNIQSNEYLNDLKCVNGTINSIQFK